MKYNLSQHSRHVHGPSVTINKCPALNRCRLTLKQATFFFYATEHRAGSHSDLSSPSVGRSFASSSPVPTSIVTFFGTWNCPLLYNWQTITFFSFPVSVRGGTIALLSARLHYKIQIHMAPSPPFFFSSTTTTRLLSRKGKGRELVNGRKLPLSRFGVLA